MFRWTQASYALKGLAVARVTSLDARRPILFIADTKKGEADMHQVRVQAFSMDGTVVRIYRPEELNRESSTLGMAVDGSELFISDMNGWIVQVDLSTGEGPQQAASKKGTTPATSQAEKHTSAVDGMAPDAADATRKRAQEVAGLGQSAGASADAGGKRPRDNAGSSSSSEGAESTDSIADLAAAASKASAAALHAATNEADARTRKLVQVRSSAERQFQDAASAYRSLECLTPIEAASQDIERIENLAATKEALTAACDALREAEKAVCAARERETHVCRTVESAEAAQKEWEAGVARVRATNGDLEKIPDPSLFEGKIREHVQQALDEAKKASETAQVSLRMATDEKERCAGRLRELVCTT